MTQSTSLPIANWDAQLARGIKDFTFDGGGLVLLFGVALIITRSRSHRRLGTRLGTIALILMVCALARPTAQILAWPLNSWAYATAATLETQLCLEEAHILVVYGGGAHSPQLPASASLTRIVTAAQFLANPAHSHFDTIIFSGGYAKTAQAVEAEVEAAFFRLLAPEWANTHTVLVEGQAANTYQNAAFVRQILTTNGEPLTIALVTSDYHQLRSTLTTRRQGFRVCPVPVESPQNRPIGLVNFENGTNTISIINELIGISGYWLRDWI